MFDVFSVKDKKLFYEKSLSLFKKGVFYLVYLDILKLIFV